MPPLSNEIVLDNLISSWSHGLVIWRLRRVVVILIRHVSLSKLPNRPLEKRTVTIFWFYLTLASAKNSLSYEVRVRRGNLKNKWPCSKNTKNCLARGRAYVKANNIIIHNKFISFSHRYSRKSIASQERDGEQVWMSVAAR